MTFKKCRFQQLILALTLPLALGFYSDVKVARQRYSLSEERVIPHQLLGQRGNRPPRRTRRGRINVADLLRFVLPSRGAPGKRVDVASRTDCPQVTQSLTALIPRTNIGLTVSERPTFWFYIPYESTKSVEFVLLDEKKKTVYQTILQLTGTPGIVGISLPPTAPPLERGKQYQWIFSFICDPAVRWKDASVNGYVERVPPNSDLRNQLENATTPRERIFIYATQGLWHETLTYLAEERHKNPQNAEFIGDWENLLQQPEVSLNEIVSKPIVPCCTLNP